MPTSSQALILHKSNVDARHGIEDVNVRPLCSFKEPVNCSIATVYNLSGCVAKDAADRTTGNGYRSVGRIISRESVHAIKNNSLPDAFRSGISITDDRPRNPFNTPASSSGDVVSGTEQGPPQRSESLSCCREATSRSSIVSPVPGRPKSAVNLDHRSKSRKMLANPFLYQQLIHLGFRSSTLALDKDCVYDSFSGRKTPFLDNPQKSKITGTRKATSTAHVKIEKTPATATTSAPSVSKPKPNVQLAVNDKEEDEDEDGSDTGSECGDIDLESGLNRIKPSIHMRKDVPEPRPRAAIFSFRDNEYSSHAEVKYLIEKQIGVKVKAIQFDPLDIRLANPSVHSRWIVDFHTDRDLELALRKGLVLGKDKLIFYRHDDIAKREVNTFKYFMTIQEAKKKLKGSSKQSLRKVTSQKQTASTKDQKNLRNTKSTDENPISNDS